MALSEKQAPFCEPYALAGNSKGFRSKGPTAEAVKRALSHLGFLPWADFDQHWNAKVNDAAAAWKRKRGLIPADSNDGSWGQKSHDVMRSAWFGDDKLPAFDGGSQKLLKQEAAAGAGPDDGVPDLGALWDGGLSVLDHDLTHATSGIPLFPALDDAFQAGRKIIAPENLTVTKQSSSNPGDAFYAEGVSGIAYWFGHLVSAPANGKRFAKGDVMGEVLNHNVGGGPHVHVGVNVETIWGSGKQLEHKTSYQHGAPLIGTQLAQGPK